MSKLLILPNGDAIASCVIKTVALHKNRGVLCRDSQQRIAAWIPTPDEEIGKAVRDLLITFAQEGHSAQPDWTKVFASASSDSENK